MTRVDQGIRDIGDADELIAWAAAAQLARLDEDHKISNRAVARACGMDPGNLANALHRDHQRLNDERLRQLDEAICALAPELENTGGLTSLSLRLRGLTDRTSLVAQVPCSWTSEMLLVPPATEFDVLIQASALLTMFMAVDNSKSERDGIRAIRQHYSSQMSKLVDQLIMIGASPPTPRNTDALALVGGLAKYSFETTKDHLQHALQTMPLGFRMWRTVTALVQLSKTNPGLAGRVSAWVHHLLNEADRLRLVSVYPGRSLELELAIAIPPEWSPPGERDWVHQFLLARARNTTATIRERGTAAHGLWQRMLVYDPAHSSKGKDELGILIQEFQSPEARPDAAAGLQWIAVTLRNVLDNNVAICNDWPTIDQPWLHAVNDAADSLNEEFIPQHIRSGAQALFRHALLQNAGVERREAIDTLVAGGWTESVVNALGNVLTNEKTEAWLRIRALFALGFLQHRDLAAAQILTTAFHEAFEKITRSDPTATPSEISEMHAVLFAMGDCFGAESRSREAHKAREQVKADIANDLRHLVIHGETDASRSFLIARAAAYMLTVTASDRPQRGMLDISEELIRYLSEHQTDATTKRLCDWALNFRFESETGRVRPLLHAAW
ncbi:hypothetical protein ACGFSI_12095 [Streptomyces virginiae]|uniref:hypothetical protein n=1 Tax=Streptomyces virginiae TaxID=1961 RepID=UPI003715049A